MQGSGSQSLDFRRCADCPNKQSYSLCDIAFVDLTCFLHLIYSNTHKHDLISGIISFEMDFKFYCSLPPNCLFSRRGNDFRIGPPIPSCNDMIEKLKC